MPHWLEPSHHESESEQQHVRHSERVLVPLWIPDSIRSGENRINPISRAAVRLLLEIGSGPPGQAGHWSASPH